jgi:hypothetical protein
MWFDVEEGLYVYEEPTGRPRPESPKTSAYIPIQSLSHKGPSEPEQHQAKEKRIREAEMFVLSSALDNGILLGGLGVGFLHVLPLSARPASRPAIWRQRTLHSNVQEFPSPTRRWLFFLVLFFSPLGLRSMLEQPPISEGNLAAIYIYIPRILTAG